MHTFAVVADRDHAKLPGVEVYAAEQLAVYDNPTADAGAHGDADEVLELLSGTAPALTQRRAVGIVFHDYRQMREGGEEIVQICAVHKVQRARFCCLAGMHVDMAGETDADTGNLVILLIGFDYLFPRFFKRLFVLGRVELLRRELFAMLVDQAMLDVGSPDIKTNKIVHRYFPFPVPYV